MGGAKCAERQAVGRHIKVILVGVAAVSVAVSRPAMARPVVGATARSSTAQKRQPADGAQGVQGLSSGSAGPVKAPKAHGSAGLVLELYAGSRPKDADELMAPVLAELEARGFAAGPGQSSKIIEASTSRPGLSTAVSADALRDSINTGYHEFLVGNFQATLDDLRGALELIKENPALVVMDQTMRPVHMRALIGLALSLRRLGRSREAALAMDELVRAFPNAEISAREYGPEPAQFFREQAAALARQGTGKLVVETNDQTAVIFIDESFRGVGHVEAKLLPGTYRVYVQRGKEVGRASDVTVEAGRENHLVVDLALDESIRTTARWSGLVLPEGEHVEDQAIEYAVKLGRSAGVDRVVLLGLEHKPAEDELVGTMVAMTGRRVRRKASLSLRPIPSSEARGALGRFLAGEDPSRELEVSIQDGRPFSAVGAGSTTGGTPWKWVVGSGAVAVAATGLVFLALDGRCKGSAPDGGGECPNVWNTAAGGWAALGVAGALGVTATYLFYRDAHRAERIPRVAVVPSPRGVDVWAGFRF